VRRFLQKEGIEGGPVDVGRVVEEIVELTRPLALSRQISLWAEVAEHVPRARADVIHVQQVLLNLLQNAIDAVSGQPADARHILIRATRSGRDVEISVTDSGPGISSERLAHIFDPFFTTKAEGLGMGLAICRTIVRSHGGDIRAENNASGGATVSFTLPAHVADEGKG
jgi:C4-dicarboxylate-specific signal transduction histidine kinase